MIFNKESDFEEALIKILSEKGWEKEVLKNYSEQDLLRNWANILFENNRDIDRLNDYPLTDSEMQQILEQIEALRTPLKLNGFINGKSVSIVRDNPDDKLHLGKEVSLKIYDRREIAAGQSRYQIVQQPKFPTKSKLLNDRRGDLMLLIKIGDDYSALFIKNIKLLLETKYEIAASTGKRVRKDTLNIVLIHNAEYYNGVNDPHDEVYDGVAVQHITFENFSDNSEFALATVVHEIIVKKDIEEGRITLFDWEELGFDREVSFGMETKIDEEKRYFFMKINPDGTFEIQEKELSLFETNEYSEMTEIFEQGRTELETVRGVIKFADENINVIKDSGLFTIPETAKIKELLEKGDNKLRGRERREELLTSLLDIKLYEENGAYYYFVGTIGEGMRQKIPRAAVIRKVEGYNGADLCFDRLLPLLNVLFVHNGQLTVIPFPFKYLREYVNR